MSTKTHSAVDELNDLERTIIESALSYNGLIDVPTAAHEAGLEETKAREILVCLLDRDIMTVSDGLYEVRDRRKFEAALNNSSPGAPATIEHVKPTPPKPIEVKSYANLPDLVEDLKLQGAEPRQMITAAEEQGLGNSLSIRYYLAFSAANPELYNSRVSPEHESSGYGDHHDSEDEPERKLVMFLLYMSEKHG
ncbi:MAG TPA: hypothetical protein VI968_03445, partial [archaeon]|nr:hypothetical protein [archaeon]